MTQPPFATFNDLFAAEPHGLAAAGLDLFRTPKIRQNDLQTWLRSLVMERGQTFLGLNVGEPPPLEASEHRIILIWEHAMVAARTVDGSDHTATGLLLLDPRVMGWAYEQRLQHLRSATSASDLR
ncbi:MAG TPA: hypothetical protein IAA98_13410 [Candidatus Avipropionibacterium avicola]|uniref:Uncharacterized protein n=1 Tax=Candidatus Avipropionibacterium avicola TaxID=2840701 RepID=A0A9D1KNI8_9ACTN|nr:hypothetical protein [Candidatus Avipropionibacterium avicola]